jgi:hypothetical protein
VSPTPTTTGHPTLHTSRFAPEQSDGPDVLGPRWLVRVLFITGPVLSLWALTSSPQWFPPHGIPLVMVVLLWSPAFCSIPALILQHSRDRYWGDAAGLASLWRSVTLVPAMCSTASPVRVEMWCSLTGWAALLVTSQDLLSAASSLLGAS